MSRVPGFDLSVVVALDETLELAPLLRTEDAQTGEVINETMLRNLPQVDRNPLELLRLPGLVSGSGVAGIIVPLMPCLMASNRSSSVVLR